MQTTTPVDLSPPPGLLSVLISGEIGIPTSAIMELAGERCERTSCSDALPAKQWANLLRNLQRVWNIAVIESITLADLRLAMRGLDGYVSWQLGQDAATLGAQLHTIEQHLGSDFPLESAAQHKARRAARAALNEGQVIP